MLDAHALRRIAPLVLALPVALLATSVRAHQVGLSRGTYELDGATISAEIVFARGELRDLVPGLDGDGDGAVSDGELARGAALQSAIVDRVLLLADDRACPGTFDRAALVEEDGHRHIALVARAGSGPADSLADWILHARSPQASVTLSGAPEAPPPPPPTGEYFALGVEHILIGIDHLVFLLGLVLVGGRWRSLLAVVTAFTLGHSLSLALATLNIWTPSGGWVEPAIAASIAYVGVENFFVKDAADRWRITLPFGFIHGFGFAGALGDIGVPQDNVGLALFLFNLGVEAGQLAVLVVLLPLLALLRRNSLFRAHGTRAISFAVVLAGVMWFVERTVLS
jgi:hypothetical protein